METGSSEQGRVYSRNQLPNKDWVACWVCEQQEKAFYSFFKYKLNELSVCEVCGSTKWILNSLFSFWPRHSVDTELLGAIIINLL